MNPPTCKGSDRFLRFLLRYIGTVSALALVAVFLPYRWMDGIHRWLGMGALPSDPIVGYLARTLSLIYALLGGLLWLCSFDLPRHRSVLCYLGAAFLVFGVLTAGIDFIEQMPPFWKFGEGPIVILFGSLILSLSLKIKPKPTAGTD